MPTKDMSTWNTAISEVISTEDEEEILVRGQPLSQLIGKVSFAEMMFLMLRGSLPTPAQARVLDALLVASMEHGIAPPSMISRCFASYGTSIQAAVGGGVLAFGDRMGGLGEQLAQTMVAQLAAHDPDNRDVDDATLAEIAARIVADAQQKGQRVPGYGIPLHRADPRAPGVLAVARAEGTHGNYCRLGLAIEAALATQRGGKVVPMNLDGVSAAVILDLGFAWQSTRLFLLTPRSVSMGAHYLEEKAQDSTWRHIPADQISYDR
ncbi:MAG: citryl-CoA lyase [Proteobacteria bacterium]|nr:citryl-CoA lyase [Pseudomonadota bacterium]